MTQTNTSPKYPDGATLEESYHCCECPFKNEPVYCRRLQEHRRGCLILDSRAEPDDLYE